MQRKLTAILSADIVGFSGLMEADEAGTLARLKANRSSIFDPAVAAHGGRLVKLMGDGALVEFASIVAAVECALAVQRATAEAEPEHGERHIRYRIGVNLGDVIVDGDDLYGDGVNVAARLQAIAPPGGIALSETVRDHVAGKVACAFEDLGPHTLKNIERPIHVHAVRPPTPAGQGAAPAPRGLSICVLPFANMSGEQEQEYFSDGISEDIITDLSKVAALRVTARNTAFTFKGKSVDVPKIARELGVSHVLEGSVRKAGGRVRITAQLIDGISNGHVWAERYDRDLTNIFALQDEISKAIVTQIGLKLLPEEQKAISHRGTQNVDAYNLYLMARQYLVAGNLSGVRRHEAMIRIARRAIEIDPNYAQAWALIGLAQVALGFYSGRRESGREAVERALALDDTLAEAHAARSRLLGQAGQYDEARREVEIALGLDPNAYEVNAAAGHHYFLVRRPEDAIRYYEQAAAQQGAEGGYVALVMLATCYAATGDKSGAAGAARRGLPRIEAVIANEPDNGDAMGHMVGMLSTLGENERARDWARRAMVLDPDSVNMHYNIACAFAVNLNDAEAAIEQLAPIMEKLPPEMVSWAKADPDLDSIRSHPRFIAMIARAEARVAGAKP